MLVGLVWLLLWGLVGWSLGDLWCLPCGKLLCTAVCGGFGAVQISCPGIRGVGGVWVFAAGWACCGLLLVFCGGVDARMVLSMCGFAIFGFDSFCIWCSWDLGFFGLRVVGFV